MRPADEWPHQGRIVVENVDVHYRENLPLVLKGINCAIATREKVKSGTHQRKFIFTTIEVTHEKPRFS